MLRPERFWIRPGWHSLAEAALADLSKIGVEEVVEIREKLGELRISVRPQPELAEQIKRIVSAVADASLTVCDLCGMEGRLLRGPWRRTRCSAHADVQQ